MENVNGNDALIDWWFEAPDIKIVNATEYFRKLGKGDMPHYFCQYIDVSSEIAERFNLKEIPNAEYIKQQLRQRQLRQLKYEKECRKLRAAF
jgi:hypothetical protein